MADLEKRLSALEAQVAGLEKQVRRQNDRIEIENMMGRHQYLYAAGLGGRIVDELWCRRADASIEYGASGLYEDLWRVRSFYVKAELPGRLSTHALTTQTLEVAEDGQTAHGLWMALGTETDSGDLGPAPPGQDDQRRMLLSSETEDGKKYRAEWLWQKVEVTFVREGGRASTSLQANTANPQRSDVAGWKIWRLHVSEFFRCPFGRDWVRFASERFATDGMWLESLFETPEPLPPEAHGENLPSGPSTYHWQYTTEALPQLLPEPPQSGK